MLEYYRFKVIHDLFIKGQTEEACMQLKELQKRYVAQCEENSALRAQIREYEDILFLARNFIFDGHFYWLITGSIKQGPFCPTCYNRDGQLIRVNAGNPRRCPSCNETFALPQTHIKPNQGGNISGILEQTSAVSSLRAFAALEQLAQAQLNQEKPETPRKAVKAKIIPLNR